MGAETGPRCLNCGSTNLLDGVYLTDYASASLHRMNLDTKPDAAVFKGTIHADIVGIACGSCGYIALFLANPAEFAAQARQ